MKILTVMMKYDYGIEQRGHSYEYYNVYLPLCDIAGESNVKLFDFFEAFNRSGKTGMNKKLKEIIQSEKPDLSIFCLFTDEFDSKILDEIRGTTKTVAYFFDDPWRQSFVRRWINHFDYFTTSDHYALMNYRTIGIKNALYCPFGFNVNIYKKIDTKKNYNVSFVGGYSGYREWVIRLLKKNGINVNIFGRGWGSKGKWISQEEMVMVFNQSKINLNLSNSVSRDYRYLLYTLRSPKALKESLRLKKNREMLKGRHYEINACGGFQISYYVAGLNLIYEIDKEIAVYDDPASLIYLIKLFLKNEELTQQVANNAYQRSLAEHSAQNYIKKVVDSILK